MSEMKNGDPTKDIHYPDSCGVVSGHKVSKITAAIRSLLKAGFLSTAQVELCS